MGQAGASGFTINVPTMGVPASGMVTMPNGLPNYSQHEGMSTAPRHDGLGSVGSVGSVATNFDALAVTNFNGVTSDGLAATRIPDALAPTRLPGQQVDGLESVSSVRTRANGFTSDGYAMAHQDGGHLGYDGRLPPPTNYSIQPSDGVPSRRFSIESDGMRDEDLHGVIGVELPVPRQGQRPHSSLAQTVTSMSSGFVPPGYHVGAGDLGTTQEAASTYRPSGPSHQSLETTTVAANAYVPRSHAGQVPHGHVNSSPAQRNSSPTQMNNSQQGSESQGNQPHHGHSSNFVPPASHGHSNNFGPSAGSCNIAAPAAAFQQQAGQYSHTPSHNTATASAHPPAHPPAKPSPQASEAQQRAAWAVGSILEVFSATAQRWHVASVVQAARSDGPDVLTVQFLRNGEPQLKQIYRTDAYLSVLGAHTEGEIPPGFQLQPSQSRPGQFVYFDTATSKKYSSVELAWKLHFERVLKKAPCGNAPRTGHQASNVSSVASMTPYGPAPTIACK